MQGYDIVGITEALWDGSHDWSLAMEGHGLFRKDSKDRRGRGVALYVREQLECVELCPGTAEESTESLLERGQAKVTRTVGAC